MSYGQAHNGPRRFVPAQAWMYDRNAAREDKDKLPRTYYGNHFARPELVDVRTPVYRQEPLKDARGVDRRATGSWTYIRILPTRDANAPDQWAPQTEPGLNTGQWLYSAPLWRGGMTRQLTIMPWWPWEDDDRDLKERNPVNKLRWAIWDLQKKNVGEWWFRPLVTKKDAGSVPSELLGKGLQKSTRLCLPGVQMNFLIRAIPYQWGDKPCESYQGLGPDDRVVLFDLGPAASEAIALETAQYGGDFSLSSGCFHCIFGNGDDPRKDEPFRKIGSVGYEVFRSDASAFWNGWPSPDLSQFHEVLWPKLVPFSDCLIVHPRETQARLLSEAFHPNVLRAAWRDDDELMRVVADVHGPESNPVISAGPQQSYHQQPPPPYQQGYPQSNPDPRYQQVPPQYQQGPAQYQQGPPQYQQVPPQYQQGYPQPHPAPAGPASHHQAPPPPPTDPSQVYSGYQQNAVRPPAPPAPPDPRRDHSPGDAPPPPAPPSATPPAPSHPPGHQAPRDGGAMHQAPPQGSGLSAIEKARALLGSNRPSGQS